MDMANSIAAMSMDMSASKLQAAYSTSMVKKTMDTEELVAKELLEMLPQVPKGDYIDTYA